jgi:hypothetical protein
VKDEDSDPEADDSPAPRGKGLTRALRTIRDLQEAGDVSAAKDAKQALARAYGVCAKTIDNWLPVLDLPAALLAAVDRGQIEAGTAVRLVGAPDEVVEQVIEALQSGSEALEIKRMIRQCSKQTAAEDPKATTRKNVRGALNKIKAAKKASKDVVLMHSDPVWEELGEIKAVAEELLQARPAKQKQKLKLKLKLPLKGGRRKRKAVGKQPTILPQE